MKYQFSTLKNGLRVATVHMAEAQSVAVMIFAGVGSRYEKPGVDNGVSHFLEHLLFKGTKKRPSTKIISEEIDSVGGTTNAYTSQDLTAFYIKLPKRHLNLALDILTDVIQHSLLDPAEIDRERGVVVEEMNVVRDDPARHIWSLVPPLIWPGDPLSLDTIGTEEIIQNVPQGQIADFVKQHYVASNLVVAVAGDIKHEEITREVESLMSDLPDQKTKPLSKLVRQKPNQTTAALAQPTNQAHLIIAAEGYPYKHADDPAARLTAAILGRGLSSRLFLKVREELGLAYSVSADYSNYVDTGMFEIYAGVNLDKIEQALEAIMEEVEKIKREVVGEAELNKAKNKVRGSLEMNLENNLGVADLIGTQLILLNEYRSPEVMLGEIDAVTPAQIKKVAATMLAKDRLRFAIIAPEPDSAVELFRKLTEK